MLNELQSKDAAAEYSLTNEDREWGMRYILQTKSGITGAIQGLTLSQWQFKPSADGWSISQVVEHVLFVFGRLVGPMRERIAESPSSFTGRPDREIDAIVINEFPKRLSSLTSPPIAVPAGDIGTPDNARRLVSQRYAETTRYLESNEHLRGRVLDALPLIAITDGRFRTMDGFQWILATVAHAERHTKQILEIRSSHDFPTS